MYIEVIIRFTLKGEQKMIKTKLAAALEKPFADQNLNDFAEYTEGSALLVEKFSFQMLYT